MLLGKSQIYQYKTYAVFDVYVHVYACQHPYPYLCSAGCWLYANGHDTALVCSFHIIQPTPTAKQSIEVDCTPYLRSAGCWLDAVDHDTALVCSHSQGAPQVGVVHGLKHNTQGAEPAVVPIQHHLTASMQQYNTMRSCQLSPESTTAAHHRTTAATTQRRSKQETVQSTHPQKTFTNFAHLRNRRTTGSGMMYPMLSACGKFWKATPTTTSPRSAGPPLLPADIAAHDVQQFKPNV
jgi:hypothetical protein